MHPFLCAWNLLIETFFLMEPDGHGSHSVGICLAKRDWEFGAGILSAYTDGDIVI